MTAFTRYGFGFVMRDLGLLEKLSIPKRMFIDRKQEIHTKTLGERVRMFLEDLGPTFVKVGQISSTRPDVFPADVIRELEKLQDHVPPFGYEDVQRIVEQELGAKLESVFDEFGETPLAAASIGQVHYAVLKTGERVAVKIQRPNIKNMIETDLEILQDLAALAQHRLEWADRYQIVDVVDEFAKTLREELDYANEGRNAEKIAKQFKNDPNIRVPKVYWDYSTAKVLTMEYIEGTKLNEINKLEQNGHNRHILAERIANATFQQVLIDGFFHGDPHPGNIYVMPKDVIVLMDFGMVGRLTSEMKDHFETFVIAMMRQNTDGVIKAITSMGMVPDDIDMSLFRADVDYLREKYYDVPFSQISLGQAVNDLFAVAFRHRIRIPADLTLLGKAMLTMEGVVARLDPDLSIVKVAEPFGVQLLKERYHPKNVTGKVWNHFTEYGNILTDLPKNIKEFTSTLKKGKMRMEISIPEIDLLVKRLNRMSNQLSFSIVLLSFSIIMVGLIVGSALVMQPSASLLWRIPAIEIGFGIATIMFLWLLFSIFRSGRF